MCLRADHVVVGAVFVALATGLATVAIDRYIDGNAMIAAVEEHAPTSVVQPSLVESQVELAAVKFGGDQHCLAEAMYHEARNEGVVGEEAVAEVILQRVRDRYYPNTVCGVVYEGTERGSRFCQFSYACDGSLDEAIEPKAWERSSRLASHIMAGTINLGGLTNRAIAYHTVAVSPEWAAGMVRTAQIGNHIFYRRAAVVRTRAELGESPTLRSGVLQADGTIVPFEPLRIR